MKANDDFVIIFCNDKKPEIESIINETRNIPKEKVKMCVISSDSEIKNSLKKKII